MGLVCDPFNKNLVFDWNPGEPNNALGETEYCITLLQRPGDARIGLNDFPCAHKNDAIFNNVVMCQKMSIVPVNGHRYKYWVKQSNEAIYK